MSAIVLLLGGVVLGALGWWTALHPDGGYRAVGGAGSGLSPETRRTSGVVLLAIGAVCLALAITLFATGQDVTS
jgi:hypothetical protein